MILITFTVGLIFFFIHITDIWTGISFIFKVLAPILYGLVIAYVLNYPFRFFRDKAFKKMGTKHPRLLRFRTPLALLTSYVLVFGLLILILSILVPELEKSLKTLFDNLPSYIKSLRKAFDDFVLFFMDKFGYNLYDLEIFSDIVDWITGASMLSFLTDLVTKTLAPAAIDIGVALYNWLLGVIISIYVLSSKETLQRQTKRLIVAFTPDKFNRFIFKVTDVVNNKCGKFIVGRVIDSSIIAVMCFIGMSIFQFHYPLLISFLVGVFNMIPFFGPFIAAIPSALLLLIIDPMEALWFLIFDIILQQFDGNILGPKVIGESVGISGFWIMVSVIVSGGLFGIPGMLLGVPMFAAIHVLLSEGVNNRLKKKKLKAKTVAAEGDSAITDPDLGPPDEPSEPLTESNNL